MGLNWSAGFAGAANALNQGLSIHAQQQIEEMKDKRAENLARLQMAWRKQHDDDVQHRQFEHDEQVAKYNAEREDQRAKDMAAREDARSAAALAREKLMLDASNSRQQAALSAASERQDQQLTQAQEIQRRSQLMQLHDQQRRDNVAFDNQEKELRLRLEAGMEKNPSIKFEQDPVKRAQLIANDPTLSGIAMSLQDLKRQRANSAADYVMRAADLGDQRFTGMTDAQVGYNPNDPSTSADGSSNVLPPLSGPGLYGLGADPVTTNLGSMKPPSLIQFGPGQNTGAASAGSSSDLTGQDSSSPQLIQ